MGVFAHGVAPAAQTCTLPLPRLSRPTGNHRCAWGELANIYSSASARHGDDVLQNNRPSTEIDPSWATEWLRADWGAEVSVGCCGNDLGRHSLAAASALADLVRQLLTSWITVGFIFWTHLLFGGGHNLPGDCSPVFFVRVFELSLSCSSSYSLLGGYDTVLGLLVTNIPLFLP